MNLIRAEDQWEIISTKHNRALQENTRQIIEEYYFPGKEIKVCHK